jgi:predicted kinase
MNGRLFFLCGAPRSGKSTYCQKWLNNPSSCCQNWIDDYVFSNPRVIVSGDSIRLATHGKRYNRLCEDSVFSTLHIMTRTLLISGFDVLVDETNTSKISIQRMLEIDNNAIAIVIDTPEDVCIERAISTNQLDLIPAIKRISKNLKIIKDDGGIHVFMNKILEEIKERKNEYSSTINTSIN